MAGMDPTEERAASEKPVKKIPCDVYTRTIGYLAPQRRQAAHVRHMRYKSTELGGSGQSPYYEKPEVS